MSQSDQETILFYLDALLLMLSGAIDATALVANVAYSVGAPSHTVGWRRAWRKQLAQPAPDLFDLTSLGTPTRSVIDLVALARNTIHGEPLGGVRYTNGAERRTLVRVHAHVTAELGRGHGRPDALSSGAVWSQPGSSLTLAS